MSILLHICCANCVIVPSQELKERGEEVVGYFFNPNIHPFQEYQKRLETLELYAEKSGLEVVYRNEYPLEEFLKNVALRPEERCHYCYRLRLEATAREAKRNRFDRFSTTLLYSIYQKHDLVREMGERIGEEVGISFHYEDFRRGWKEGVNVSKAMRLYRQQYCGCIYSEKERFMKKKNSLR
jgi:hypothetical protein